MPVTARLSRKFYERFGDDLTNELVEWFNQVDATYRSDLRELNDLNWARFEAKLDQRIAEVRADLRAAVAQLETKLIRWMFLFWVGTLGTLIALLKL
jgi:phosphate uptake regulator